jgi:hypothetical protein
MTDVAEIERTIGVRATQTRKLGERDARYAPVAALEERALGLLEQHCVAWDGDGFTVFFGALEGDRSHGLYIAPWTDAIALMRLFAVGTHNGSMRVATKAQRGMERIQREAPFVPYFADAAGFKVKFKGAVSDAQAEAFEALVLEFNIEAIELVEQAGDEGPLLAAAIQKNRRLELWWD